MHHPHRAAARELDLATRDIAARRYDIAETRLTLLLRSIPDFAEAWHKRAVLYYLLGGTTNACTTCVAPSSSSRALRRDAALRRSCARRAADDARFALRAARSIHPHLSIPTAALADGGADAAQL